MGSETGAGSGRPAAKRWSAQEVADLIALWSTDLTNAQIAARLGREESAVAVKASRISLPRRSDMRAAKKRSSAKMRKCLRCESPFYSTGSGNRICDPCKESSDWQNGGDYFATSNG